MAGILNNPTLNGARISAAFDNNGARGAVNVPEGWAFVYLSGDKLKMVERPGDGEGPIWLEDRPPQTYPSEDGGAFLETSSYTGIAGFRQRVMVEGRRYYAPGVVVTARIRSNEPSPGTIGYKIRLHHSDGVAEEDWFMLPEDAYGQEIALNVPLVQPSRSGEIGFEFLVDVHWPVVSALIGVRKLDFEDVDPQRKPAIKIAPFKEPEPAWIEEEQGG